MRWYLGLAIMGFVGAVALFPSAQAGDRSDALLVFCFVVICLASSGAVAAILGRRRRATR